MKNLTENNKWALVTGASGGVGKEIAKILAKKGYSVLSIKDGISDTNTY